MMNAFGNIFKIPELRKRILVTLALLAVYRVGCYIPTPGIDREALASFFQQAGGILGFFNMFAGGAMKRFSVFALGIMPYISAAIILQLLTVVVPHLERLQKEGELGRRKINQYTRYGTVLLCFIQGFGIAIGLEGMRGAAGEMIVLHPGWGFRLTTMITLAAGTTFLMWLGEQITERGIGNGISLIIFAGIVANMPQAAMNTFRLMRAGEINLFFSLFLVVLMVAVVAFIIFMETSQRRIPIQYAKRIVGRRVYGGQSAHLPLKLNTSGVIPPIFASSILMFPATVANFINHPWMEAVKRILTPVGLIYNLLYVGFIIFFCYFYTAVVFNPVDVADNMKKYGGFIPGIRPGRPTSEYIDRVLTRITLVGALYVSAVCVLPSFLIAEFHVPFYFGGTALLIVVGVALDTVQQIEAHLLTRQYEGLVKGMRMRGRRR
ncbi:MAG: preprotein translocase subunit SecY [Deltaproteobacteria bacterium]|nr:MAG: preprotein translocase subunit SecY [Deltaproteobacteria bacterium]